MMLSTPTFPEPLRTVEGITEYKLPNGLTVLLLPDQAAQNITVCVTYLVGSRHEGRGEAGMAHLLEHMLFKGTPTHKNIKSALQDRGAFYNATTWYDRTNYFETLAATPSNLEFALKLEADRMINSRIRKKDLDTEMTVVRNEFEMGENEPTQVLHQQMMGAAYQWHSYGKPTIGNRSDIERVSIKNLREFYKHYYQPDNAVLMVAGNFNIEQTQAWILQYFANIPRPTRKLDSTYTLEPTQDGPREVVLQRAGEIAQAAVMYHIPAASHPDCAALLVLSQILCDEPSGLLFQSLVKTGLAVYANTSVYALKEPGIFLASSRPAHNDQAKEVLERMIHLLENLTGTAINTIDVERAKTRFMKYIKMDIMKSNQLAMELSESIAQGDYRLFFYTRDRIKQITADDVIRVAHTYLIESNRTTGLYIPTETIRAAIPVTPDVASMLTGYAGSEEIHLGEEFEATPENMDAHTIRSVLSGTIKTSLLSKSTRGQANRARLVFRFGDEETLQGKQMPLNLIPNLLRRGSRNLTYQQVQDKLDAIQSTLGIYAAQPGVVIVDITSDRQHLAEVMGIASELMQSPRFNQDDFSLIQKRTLTDLLQARSDPIQSGLLEVERLRNPFPHDSIHYVPTFDERISELNATTLAQCEAVYHEFYGSNHLEVAMVGDVDPAINTAIENYFGHWQSPAIYHPIFKPAVPAIEESRVIVIPDKQMAVVALGVNFAMRDDDIYYPAMRIANYIFGESMKSRLLARLREKEGLSYDAGSFLEVNRHDASAGLTLYAMCATDKAEFTLNAMLEEYHRWINNGVTKDELHDGIQSFELYSHNVLADDARVLTILAGMIDVNRTFGYYTQLLNKVEKLKTQRVHKVLKIYLSKAPVAVVKAGDFE